jgi:regulator of protease activity HflC (stomatin/prohibitin superfamily)
MRKFLFLVVGFLALAMLMGCTRIEQGHVGLKVHLLGSDKGSIEILGPGVYGNAINVEYVQYPTFIKQYPFTKGKTEGAPIDEAIYFQSRDGVSCNVDVAVTAFADATKADMLYKEYRKGIEEILTTNVRQSLRNAFVEGSSTMTVDDLYSNKKIGLLDIAKKRLVAEFAPLGLIVQDVSYLSDIRFPTEIESAIKAKYAAVQAAMQRENEVAKATAEAQIKVANAKGDSEANRLNAISITPQVIQLREIEVQKAWIERWDGKLPQVQGAGGTITDIRQYMPAAVNK